MATSIDDSNAETLQKIFAYLRDTKAPEDIVQALMNLDDLRRDSLLEICKLEHEVALLHDLSLQAVRGLERTIPQDHSCNHDTCIAVRRLRTKVDPGVVDGIRA